MKSKVTITKESHIWINEDEQGVIYYRDGQKHREDGPAIDLKNGTRQWFINGKLHREDGPAAELHHGTKQWWLNGKLHRDDGPAVESADGSKQWFLNGISFTEEEFKQWLEKKNLNEKLHNTLEPKHREKKNKI